MKHSFKWEKKYLYWGITAFCVIAACVLFYMLLSRIPAISTAVKKLGTILSPFIWGLVLTYLLAPVMRLLENKVFAPIAAFFLKKDKKGKDGKKFARGFSVFFSIIFLLLLMAGLVYLVIPQLYSSIETIVINSNSYVETVSAWVSKTLQDYPEAEAYVTDAMGSMQTNLVSWLTNSVLPGLGSMITSVAGGLVVVVKGIYNLVIGIIVSVYILANLESFGAWSKRLLYCVFSVKTSDKICDLLEFTNKTFMGYITGTLVDSAIIGLLCYIFCAIVNMPYTLLVSVLVGVTNIIPFFGPFIGAIPSGLIILLDNPFKCLVFVIFIFILQQCDGNLIKPKILGESIGINGFWVLFSIIVGAGLFGFWGMLLGVPVFYVIYALIEKGVKRKLADSQLPVDPEEYKNIYRIDPATREVILKNGRSRASAPAEGGEAEENNEKAPQSRPEDESPEGGSQS